MKRAIFSIVIIGIIVIGPNISTKILSMKDSSIKENPNKSSSLEEYQNQTDHSNFVDLTKEEVTLHGIPMYGRIHRDKFAAIEKLNKNVPAKLFEGIKGIYVTNLVPTYRFGRIASYISADNQDAVYEALIKFQNGETMQINLVYKDYPFIFVESGKLIDEYNLAFVIMHEIGHHQGIHVEEKAYAFARKYISDKVFEKKEDIEYSE